MEPIPLSTVPVQQLVAEQTAPIQQTQHFHPLAIQQVVPFCGISPHHNLVPNALPSTVSNAVPNAVPFPVGTSSSDSFQSVIESQPLYSSPPQPQTQPMPPMPPLSVSNNSTGCQTVSGYHHSMASGCGCGSHHISNSMVQPLHPLPVQYSQENRFQPFHATQCMDSAQCGHFNHADYPMFYG